MALPPAPKLTGGEAEGTSWSDWAAAVNDELNGVGPDAGFTEAQRTTLATTYATLPTNRTSAKAVVQSERPVTPQQFGAKADGATDDTAAFTAAFASGASEVYVPPGTYAITSEIRPASGQHVVFANGATLLATAAMTNMMQIGRTSTAANTHLSGGVFDCNGFAATGLLAYAFAHLTVSDFQVWNSLGDAIVLGDPGNTAKSYEGILDNIRIWRPSTSAVPAGSRGIWTQWSTDCEVSGVTVIGQDIGIQADNSGHQFSHVHAWGYTGKLPTICFLDTGGANSWVNVSADSPSQVGLKLTGSRTRVTNFKAFLNTFPPDATVVGILSTTATPSHRFVNCEFVARSTVRYAADYSGDYGGVAFLGWRTDGNVVAPVIPNGVDYVSQFRVGSGGANIYGPTTVQGGPLTNNYSAAQAAKFADTAGTTLAVNIRTDSSRRLELLNGAPLFGWNGPYTTNTFKLDPAVGAIQSGTSAGLGASTYSGSGVPTSTLGVVGDHFWRTDTPTTANQRLYIKTATSTWVGVL